MSDPEGSETAMMAVAGGEARNAAMTAAVSSCYAEPLSLENLARNFSDIHPSLSRDQAQIEAARCYFCYDAPCIEACPTGIDIPGFIRGIATGNLRGAGEIILESNILGGTCARVCPTEILCEGACVRTAQQEKPVEISALQRVATDRTFAHSRETGRHPFERAAPTGKRIAVVGAGPAGLACAHALAREGHTVAIYEARPKPGGLNEYGIAAYKMVDDFAAREVEFILGIGGITIAYDAALGRDVTLDRLRGDHDAVFLAIGQTAVNALAIPGEDKDGVHDAIDFISALRQAEDLSKIRVGREVVVIGGGNTAIDAATQAKRLGAEVVTIVYRRGRNAMKATSVEQDWALSNGVALRVWATPVAIEGGQHVSQVRFARTREENGRVIAGDQHFALPADMVLKAVGQRLDGGSPDRMPRIAGGRIVVDTLTRETSVEGVFAGGDCVDGADLTVQAVEDGKQAAISIGRYLKKQEGGHHG